MRLNQNYFEFAKLFRWHFTIFNKRSLKKKQKIQKLQNKNKEPDFKYGFVEDTRMFRSFNAYYLIRFSDII